ncbi:MAG: formate dehydrogenase subunit delta [Rhodoblastus sp.]
MSETAQAYRARLLHMALQIAEFFRPYGEEEAARAVAAHIDQFWTPRMRAEFLDGPAPDDPLLRRAFALVRPGERGGAIR